MAATPRNALPADDDAIEVAFDVLSPAEVAAIERLAAPRDTDGAAGTSGADADALGLRAVRALEHLAAGMRRVGGGEDPDRTALPEHLALAVGRSLSGALAPGERAVLDRALVTDRAMAARAAELEELWPRVRAWLGAPATAGDEEDPRAVRWMRWLPLVLVVAIGAGVAARFKPIFALFEERARFGAVPYAGAATRAAVGAGDDVETAIFARSFLIRVDCPGDTHVVLAAFPARGSAWRAFPRAASDALLSAGFHVLPDGGGAEAFELPLDCGPTTIVAAYRDEPLSDGELPEIDEILTRGSEGILRANLGERGFRTEVLSVVEPDR